MYYNSNKVSNDYYNSYKKEISKLQDEQKKLHRAKIIKSMFILLILSLLFLASFYIYKYYILKKETSTSNFNTKELFTENQSSSKFIIQEEKLPVSPQLLESTVHLTKSAQNNHTTSIEESVSAAINKKDIELIVKTIMAQMNTKVEKSLEEQLEEVNQKASVHQKLKEVDHYNKIVLTSNTISKRVENASLVKLNKNLQNLINEEKDKKSNYTKEIKKEIVYRKNEMRIIIVQKGDTLSKIAKRAYGNHADYKKIFAANPEIIENPNQIFIGQRLRIPS